MPAVAVAAAVGAVTAAAAAVAAARVVAAVAAGAAAARKTRTMLRTTVVRRRTLTTAITTRRSRGAEVSLWDPNEALPTARNSRSPPWAHLWTSLSRRHPYGQPVQRVGLGLGKHGPHQQHQQRPQPHAAAQRRQKRIRA